MHIYTYILIYRYMWVSFCVCDYMYVHTHTHVIYIHMYIYIIDTIRTQVNPHIRKAITQIKVYKYTYTHVVPGEFLSRPHAQDSCAPAWCVGML